MGRHVGRWATAGVFCVVTVGCSSEDDGSSWSYGGGGGISGAAGASETGGSGGAGGIAGWPSTDGGHDAQAGGSAGTGESGGGAGSGAAGGTGGTGGATGGTGGQALPTCDCYYGNGLYCGEGVAAEGASRGCSVDLLPAHNGDLLDCNDGVWTVDTTCSEGCIVADPGEPDTCKVPVSPGDYHLPWDCGDTYACTQGNNGSFSHSGNMQYAYDFGLPRHTPVLASRGGVVSHSDNVVGPGEACYEGCTTSACCDACINSGNRVVIDHGDGTSALYLHLDEATVSEGASVSSGDVLGYSGTSGCSFGSHLHFQVMSTCGIWFCASVPMSFAEYANVVTDGTYTSQNCL